MIFESSGVVGFRPWHSSAPYRALSGRAACAVYLDTSASEYFPRGVRWWWWTAGQLRVQCSDYLSGLFGVVWYGAIGCGSLLAVDRRYPLPRRIMVMAARSFGRIVGRDVWRWKSQMSVVRRIGLQVEDVMAYGLPPWRFCAFRVAVWRWWRNFVWRSAGRVRCKMNRWPVARTRSSGKNEY